MKKSGLFVFLFSMVLSSGLVFMGCASVKPMSGETMVTYGFDIDEVSTFDTAKNFQYFVSRDIVLTSTSTEMKTDIVSGQAFSSTSVERDIKQILSSTSGVVLEIEIDRDESIVKLGVAFEAENDNILWFLYSEDDDYFYLDYTDYDKKEIAYAEKVYKVTYEEASGIGAAFKRLTTVKKANDGNYESMDPLLLYEGKAKVKESEKRKTMQGRRL
jgi:hypothetical protein